MDVSQGLSCRLIRKVNENETKKNSHVKFSFKKNFRKRKKEMKEQIKSICRIYFTINFSIDDFPRRSSQDCLKNNMTIFPRLPIYIFQIYIFLILLHYFYCHNVSLFIYLLIYFLIYYLPRYFFIATFIVFLVIEQLLES